MKRRIEYKIGLNRQNEYCVEYTLLCNEYNNISELLKVWILYYYKVIYNYGKPTDRNVIELFDFLSFIKNIEQYESFNSLIENEYGKFSCVNAKECSIKIKVETVDIINSGIGINVVFPLKVNHNDIKNSIIVLTLFIWDYLNSEHDKKLFIDIVAEVFYTKNDLFIYSLEGNIIVPNSILEEYYERMEKIETSDSITIDGANIEPLRELNQMNREIEEKNNIINRSNDNKQLINALSFKRVKGLNAKFSILACSLLSFFLGVILTAFIAVSYNNSIKEKNDINYLLNTNYDSDTLSNKQQEPDSSVDTYIYDGEIHLNEYVFDEIKADAHILNWGHATFDIYNGTQYTVKAVVINISIYDEEGVVIEKREYREDIFLGIDSYSTENIKFDTGLTGIGQVSENDLHIPEHLVSWKFTDIIVESD